MWVYSSKTKTWVNISAAQRVFNDGEKWWIVCNSGTKIPLTDGEFEDVQRYIDPHWYESHDGGGISLDKSLKAIMKALNVKEEDGEEK